MNRRRFLTGAAAAGLTGTACRRQASSSRHTLSIAEAATLGALCDAIIPADSDPGALWAGAVHFIDIQLTRRYKAHRERYRAGLKQADAIAAERFGKPLAELDSAARTTCAGALEAADRHFFNLVVSHTMQSYYGSPRHGGNREYVSWRMLGVPPVPARGRQQHNLGGGSA